MCAIDAKWKKKLYIIYTAWIVMVWCVAITYDNVATLNDSHAANCDFF